MATFNFVDAGKYNWANLLGCFYTHKDGRRIRNWQLIHPADNMAEAKIEVADSLKNRAEIGGAWSLDLTSDELNKLGNDDIHGICFSPF